jgi:potassium/chloride transporter 9
VKALLEKLRIEAEVLVFWLASGQLGTYEMIIHGQTSSPDAEDAVHECLKDDEWWDDLQQFRGTAHDSMSPSEELASIASVMGSAAARPGVYNPHANQGQMADRRRASTVVLAELPKISTVSALARLGVNMGIHTQNLPANVFDSSDSELDIGSDGENDSSEENMDADFNDAASAASEGDLDDLEPARRPLLSMDGRRKSLGDILDKSGFPERRHERKGKAAGVSSWDSYGTMFPPPARKRDEEAEGSFTPLPQPRSGKTSGTVSARSLSPEKLARRGLRSDAPPSSGRLERPPLSRQSSSAMKFSSMLVPETRITNEEGSEPRIMFAQSEATGAARERPAFSRHSSAGRFSSGRPVPETKASEVQGNDGPSVSFAEPEARSRSRKTSVSKLPDDGDAKLNISDLVSSYSFGQRDDDGGSGSSYSTQGLPLSFNDLPTRAQHLILNELLRQNSNDTAVLFTTLPIPEEGTCQSEEASIRYLSDVELLCNELPPVLLVLSNNMTVTVSL